MKGYLVNESDIKKREINFIVWIIPIVSLIVAGWLVYKYYSSLGPLIVIKFKTSGGLEAKRSFVKFKDVKVGKVESIKILKNSVLVKVRMNKAMKIFLNNSTKFWIVKPEIGLNKVRGLDAIISGPYIQMYAKPKGFSKTFFIGLDTPPLDSEIVNGKVYKLISFRSYGIKEGMPVYYKDIKVGVVRRVELKNNKVLTYIVIWKKFDKYINDSTKFWNLKTLKISLREGLNVEFPTFKELMFGGIKFDTPFSQKKSKNSFKLYSCKEEAFEHILKGNKYTDINFNFYKNVAKLQINTPLKFRGYKIGEVKKIDSYYDFKTDKIITNVTATLNIGVFKVSLKDLIKKGIEIKFHNSIVGNYLTFDFNKKYKGKIYTDIAELQTLHKVNKLIDKFNSLPLKKLLVDADKSINTLTPALKNTLHSVDVTSKHMNKIMTSTSKELNVTFKKVAISIEKLANSYNNNSLFYDKTSATLKNISKSLLNLNRVLNKINKKPNSIIFGE